MEFHGILWHAMGCGTHARPCAQPCQIHAYASPNPVTLEARKKTDPHNTRTLPGNPSHTT
eukprot:9912462-Lingulodinium_polyedra.AAC.1